MTWTYIYSTWVCSYNALACARSTSFLSTRILFFLFHCSANHNNCDNDKVTTVTMTMTLTVVVVAMLCSTFHGQRKNNQKKAHSFCFSLLCFVSFRSVSSSQSNEMKMGTTFKLHTYLLYCRNIHVSCSPFIWTRVIAFTAAAASNYWAVIFCRCVFDLDDP